MIKIKKVLSELRGVLGVYGFAKPQQTEGTKGAYPFADKAKQYRGYSDAELAYARTDASDAAKNMRGHDTSAENWYQDDASTINQEIERRRGKKTKTEASTKVGDRATITGGNKKYVGRQGTISGVTGSEQPFHWQIKLDDGPEGVWKGDEFDSSTKTEDYSAWDRFLDFEGRGWDYVIEAGLGDPTDEEAKAITDLGYYGKPISAKTIAGLKAARQYVSKSVFSMNVEFPGERGSGPKFFKTKEALIKAASEMGRGEASDWSTSWVDDYGSRISITGATYGEVFPKEPVVLREPDPDGGNEHLGEADVIDKPVEARTPTASATTAMASGRYIGQVLGNVIGDIEKGHHEDAVTLLRKLKADLEKAGTEVVELWGEGK